MSIVRNGLAALLVGAIAFAAVAEEEAVQHKLDLRSSKWQAGDTVTFAITSSGTENVEVAGPDGSVMMTRKETKNIDWEAVVKAVEVDAEGRRTKCLVHFTRFSRKSEGVMSMGGQEQEQNSDDVSLTGVTIEVAGGKWTAVSPGAAVSAVGKAFLDGDFVKGHYVDDTHDVLAAHKATEPVAVGGTWKPDVKPYIASIEYIGPLTCDSAKSTADFTLKSVEKKGDVEYATIEGKHSIVVTEVMQQGMPMPFEDDSKVASTQTTVVALSGRMRPFEMKMTNDFAGTLNMGQAISVSSKSRDSESMKVGGTIPEPKKEEPKPAGGVPQDPGSTPK